MSRHVFNPIRSSLIALSTAVLALQSTAAFAQTAAQGQAPSTGAQASAPASPQTPASANRQAYAAQYEAWAQQNCVDQRNGNLAAGAIIGGALGAIAGSALTHGHTSATLAGGAVGAVAGAGIAASASSCPPGYIVRAGAPTFVYEEPYFPETVVYEDGPYAPWVWVGDHWVYESWHHVYRYGRPHVVYHWR